MILIYGLMGDDDEIRYVGQTVNTERRLKGHVKLSRAGYRSHLYNWIRSLPHSPRLKVLSVVPDCCGNRAEVACIALFKALGLRLTNATDGGEGTRGHKHSDEYRENMRGRVVTAETRARQSAVRKGRTMSPENREKRRHPVSCRKCRLPGHNKRTCSVRNY